MQSIMWTAASSLNARSSLFALCLAALQGFGPVDPFPSPSPLLGSDFRSLRRYVYLQISSDTGNFYLEITSNGQVKETPKQSSYSIVLLKAKLKDRLAILGVRSDRYLCLDAEGNAFGSIVFNEDSCLFHHRLLKNHHHLYLPDGSTLLLNMEAPVKACMSGHDLSASPVFLSERCAVHKNRQRRRRRSKEVDSSDPLCLHNQRGKCLPSQKDELILEPEMTEQSHAVSKETITSTSDDPFMVVQPPGSPGSPRSVGAEKALPKKMTALEDGGGD
ncbi:fibroblast growth factor 23-like [Megalops cyprinoides]|uniref:fibroblast growth factor 23-like n=1 Tax=Megalops cyprinoides TaxID=118141 RepID=UPI001864C283|nr:fibroblast growth factor 23-like [Megalops cyprinoides]